MAMTPNDTLRFWRILTAFEAGAAIVRKATVEPAAGGLQQLYDDTGGPLPLARALFADTSEHSAFVQGFLLALNQLPPEHRRIVGRAPIEDLGEALHGIAARLALGEVPA